MAIRKMIGLGTTLSIKVTTAASTVYTVVGGLISLPGPNGSGDVVDTSTIDEATNFKSFQRAYVDAGEMNLTLSYGSTESSSKKLGTAYSDGKMRTWKITFPSTLVTAETFTGYVKSMGRELTKDSMITRTVTVKCSGDPGFTSA